MSHVFPGLNRRAESPCLSVRDDGDKDQLAGRILNFADAQRQSLVGLEDLRNCSP